MDGFYDDKDYDREKELDIYPCVFPDSWEGVYEVNLSKKTVKWIELYSDEVDFNLKFLRKNLTSTKKYMVFNVENGEQGQITYIDKLK